MTKQLAEQSFDTLIMKTPADFQRLRHLHARIADHIPQGKLIFIGNKEVCDLAKESGDERITAIDEDTLIPFADVHAVMADQMASVLNGEELPRGVTGWYYQQFLKWEYAKHCKDNYYLVWDGDTIPCRTLRMFQEGTGKPYLDLKQEHHAEYFQTLEKILPGMHKVIGRSFISEHMLINRDICLELMRAIEANNALPGTHFWEKIIRAIPADIMQNSAFSEFETYGTYMALKHPDHYMLRDWHSFRLGGEFFDPHTICDRDFIWLGKDFDAISFEKGMSVREDHKNLFDNPAYQEKMSARIMLESAQQAFQDGYREVWGRHDANVKSGAYGESDARGEGSADTGKEKGSISSPEAGKEKHFAGQDKPAYLTPDTWKQYAALGESLLDVNPDQAYLCYENALFLYEEDRRKISDTDGIVSRQQTEQDVSELTHSGDEQANALTVRESLRQVLQMLRESGNLSLRPCAIVIISYNNTYLMQKCVESIRTHCNPDAASVIVLDNASTDGVTEWLKAQEDIALLLSDENLGFPAGCNEAIRMTEADRDILLLNNDTRMTPNALFWLRMALYEKEDVGGAGCVANYTDPSQRVDMTFPLPEDYVRYGAKINTAPLQTEAREKLSGFALLLKRPVLDAVGLFDERFSPGYFEDTDLCLRIRDAGYRLLLVRNSFIYHAGSQSFMSRDDLEALFTRNYAYACEKWGEERIDALFPDSEDTEHDAGVMDDEKNKNDDPHKVSHTSEIADLKNDVSQSDEVDISKVKVIIWDLDDTFWDGILSEGDVRFREDAVALAKRAVDMGVMNAICSKNDFETVRDALQNSPEGDLWSLFVFPSVDWTPKGARVRTLLEDMQLRPANALFIDDSDFQRREVAFAVPEIMTCSPDNIPVLLKDFRDTETKDPSHKRLEQYRVLEKKRDDKRHATSNEDFLENSQISVVIDTHCAEHLERIADLVARANQLNYTKIRSSKEEILEILQDDAVSSAVVHAYDRYGDYGIVGFYALDLLENRLLHFVFSCRALGMGVEQYIYEKLDFPELETKGEIAVPLVKEKKVTWITEKEAAPESSASGQTKPSPEKQASSDPGSGMGVAPAEKDIFIKGPCDMDQMIGFLQERIALPLYLETNFVDERGVIVAGFNNLLHLKEAAEVPAGIRRKALADAPFLSEDDFVTDMFAERHALVFFSMLSETHAGIYRHKETGFRICFSSRNFDLTDPANAPAFISGEYPNHNFDFTDASLKAFRAAYTFEGGLSAEEIAALAQWLNGTLPASAKLVLLLGSETEADPNTAEFAHHAALHREVNRLLRDCFTDEKRVRLLNITDCITGKDSFAGCTNHFSRSVYHTLAERFADISDSFFHA